VTFIPGDFVEGKVVFFFIVRLRSAMIATLAFRSFFPPPQTSNPLLADSLLFSPKKIVSFFPMRLLFYSGSTYPFPFPLRRIFHLNDTLTDLFPLFFKYLSKFTGSFSSVYLCFLLPCKVAIHRFVPLPDYPPSSPASRPSLFHFLRYLFIESRNTISFFVLF